MCLYKKIIASLVLFVAVSVGAFSFIDYQDSQRVLQGINEYKQEIVRPNQYQHLEYVQTLTDARFQGREAGAEGADIAGDWIASRFAEYGLQPYFEKSFFQYFGVPLKPLNAKNVVGFIPAHDPGVKESILIGAHYDHLGTDQAGNIYFGANDNASGVSVLLELIKVFTASTWRPKVNIVFIAFSAEEVFGFGSKHYVANPLFPVEKIVAMINLDCVGSYRGEWNIATDLLRNKAKAKRVKTAFDFYHAPLKLNNSYLKRGSDHAIFYKERVPVLFLFRNSPEDLKVLHTPEDVISLISGEVLHENTELSSLLIFLLSEM